LAKLTAAILRGEGTRKRCIGFFVTFIIVVGIAFAPAFSQDSPRHQEPPDCIWIPKSRLSDGPQVREAFRPVVADSQPATVRIRVDGRDAALGGVVGQDGWILTKASNVRGAAISCRLSDGRELEARVVGVRHDHDLLMLKIDATDLPVLHLDGAATASVGQWLATAGMDRDPQGVGIVSVATRRIAHQPGILGVQLDQTPAGPQVVRVFPQMGAAEAGMLVNDVIVSIAGEPTPTREQLQRQIRRHSPGEMIDLEVRRGDETLALSALLKGQLAGMANDDDQNRLGGILSERRAGFPAALQHDTVLAPVDCGGPVVNLDGQVVGFNIARAGRTESYAVPADVVVPLLYELMSGNRAPIPPPPPQLPEVGSGDE
jgi:serine protease Do